MLRVPEDIAISWREIALKTAQELGAIVDHENLEELPFVRDEIIYPGLNGTVTAKGLCLSQQALLNSEITQNHLSENLYSIAGFLLLYVNMLICVNELFYFIPFELLLSMYSGIIL